MSTAYARLRLLMIIAPAAVEIDILFLQDLMAISLGSASRATVTPPIKLCG